MPEEIPSNADSTPDAESDAQPESTEPAPAPAPKQEKPAPKAEQPAPKAEKPAPKAEQPAPQAEKPAPKAGQPAPEADQPSPKAVQPAAAKKTASPAASAAADPKHKPVPASDPTAGNWWWGTGRRKAAVARVRVRPGDGQFVVNRKEMSNFFPREGDQKDLLNVLEKTSTNGKLDIHVNVRGGGITGQTGAIVLGLGRALRRYDQTLEPILRDHNFLTRDPRKVERKKYGQPGARKRFQFSKR